MNPRISQRTFEVVRCRIFSNINQYDECNAPSARETACNACVSVLRVSNLRCAVRVWLQRGRDETMTLPCGCALEPNVREGYLTDTSACTPSYLHTRLSAATCMSSPSGSEPSRPCLAQTAHVGRHRHVHVSNKFKNKWCGEERLSTRVCVCLFVQPVVSLMWAHTVCWFHASLVLSTESSSIFLTSSSSNFQHAMNRGTYSNNLQLPT